MGFTLNAFINIWSVSEDTEMFSAEKLEELMTLKDNPRTFEHIWRDAKHILKVCQWITIMLGLLLLVQFLLLIGRPLRKCYWLDLLAIFAAALIIIVLNIWMDHLSSVERVFEPLLLCAMMTSCFLLSDSDKVNPMHHIINRVVFSVLIPVFIFAGMKTYSAQLETYPLTDVFYGYTDNSPRAALRADYMGKLDQDRSNVYILPLETTVNWSWLFGIFERNTADYCPNVFYLSGWGASAPHNVQRYEEYGISNPVRALYEKENVYSQYSPVILTYLQEHYDSTITVSQVKTLDGALGSVSIVKYSKLIEEDNLPNAANIQTASYAFEYGMINDTDAWILQGKLQGEFSDTAMLYCNLSKDGVRYTYRLELDEEGNFYGGLYNLPEDFAVEDANLLLIAETSAGQYATVRWNRKHCRKDNQQTN